MSKQITQLFNINGTATLTVDLDSGARAHGIYIDGGRRSIEEVFPATRAVNVRAAINFLIKDRAAQSVETTDGLTIGRGYGNDFKSA